MPPQKATRNTHVSPLPVFRTAIPNTHSRCHDIGGSAYTKTPTVSNVYQRQAVCLLYARVGFFQLLSIDAVYSHTLSTCRSPSKTRNRIVCGEKASVVTKVHTPCWLWLLPVGLLRQADASPAPFVVLGEWLFFPSIHR